MIEVSLLKTARRKKSGLIEAEEVIADIIRNTAAGKSKSARLIEAMIPVVVRAAATPKKAWIV